MQTVVEMSHTLCATLDDSTLCRGKVTRYTMCDRNAKSECILIKLSALVSECICERTAKFHQK